MILCDVLMLIPKHVLKRIPLSCYVDIFKLMYRLASLFGCLIFIMDDNEDIVMVELLGFVFLKKGEYGVGIYLPRLYLENNIK